MAVIREYTINKDDEKRIVTGVILNTKFCEMIFPRVDASMFDVDIAKYVYSWVREDFQKSHFAPKLKINDIFNEKKRSMLLENPKSEALVDLIKSFLKGINEDYETGNDGVGEKIEDADYLWNEIAKPYFLNNLKERRERKIRELQKKGNDLEAAKLDNELQGQLERLSDDTGITATIQKMHFTDTDNAELLVMMYAADLRYCHKWEKWMIWDGTRWKKSEDKHITEVAKMMAKELYRRAGEESTGENKFRAALASHAISSKSRAKINNMIELARSDPRVSTLPSIYDRDIWLLNCQNGTLDLRTGKRRSHRKEDYLTKSVNTYYDPQAKCPQWEDFLDRVLHEDEKLIAYLQRVSGYALTGSTEEQMWVFVYGPTATGKSTYLETMLGLMGDYAIAVDPSTLMVKRTDAIRSDVARMAGIRMVKTIETQQGQRLSESMIKAHTGGDTIVARNLYQGEFEFTATHKIFLGSNYMPEIKRMDDAMARRFNVIPFDIVIPKDERDPDLKEKLKKEWPGILAWAVRGCLEWQHIGLDMPTQIRQANYKYELEMDVIGRFVKEWVTSGNFLKALVAWAAKSGEEVSLNNKTVNAWFRDRPKFERGKTYPVKYTGIGLKPEFYEGKTN